VSLSRLFRNRSPNPEGNSNVRSSATRRITFSVPCTRALQWWHLRKCSSSCVRSSGSKSPSIKDETSFRRARQLISMINTFLHFQNKISSGRKPTSSHPQWVRPGHLQLEIPTQGMRFIAEANVSEDCSRAPNMRYA